MTQGLEASYSKNLLLLWLAGDWLIYSNEVIVQWVINFCFFLYMGFGFQRIDTKNNLGVDLMIVTVFKVILTWI